MPDITFGPNDKATFPTKHHGDVALSKRKWDEICAEPERFYYRHNGEKVPTTLIVPDIIRHHKKEPNQLIYYKQFDSWQITEGTELATTKFMAVVIDIATKRACTIYPTDRPKPGKEYMPAEA